MRGLERLRDQGHKCVRRWSVRPWGVEQPMTALRPGWMDKFKHKLN